MCEAAVSQRQVSRHAVDIPCEVITAERDEVELMWASDMSGAGAWLETQTVCMPGDHLVICFAPGVAWRARELQVFAEVTRISRGLRAGDGSVGMAVRFLDLSPAERWSLRCWLRPRPQPAPRRRVPTVARPTFARPAASPFAARIG